MKVWWVGVWGREEQTKEILSKSYEYSIWLSNSYPIWSWFLLYLAAFVPLLLLGTSLELRQSIIKLKDNMICTYPTWRHLISDLMATQLPASIRPLLKNKKAVDFISNYVQQNPDAVKSIVEKFTSKQNKNSTSEAATNESTL